MNILRSSVIVLVLGSIACGGTAPSQEGAPVSSPPAGSGSAGSGAQPAVPPPAFTVTDLQPGTGREAQKGRRISVHYSGWLYDPAQKDSKGRMFDSSGSRGPFTFVLGTGQVIPGWDRGFDGMQVGGRRRLVIPPDLAYGEDGAGNVIPPNATLLFEMELLDVAQ